MTSIEARPDTDPSPSSTADTVRTVADTFVELARSFSRTRARLLAQAEHNVEWSAHVVLKVLSVGGPMRSSDLAERLESDPSTVSRQVATLVKDGLLERRSDPEDGRASILVPTAKADAVLAEHNEIRRQHFQRMLQDWSEDDLRTFAVLFERFTHDYDASSAQWLTERLAPRTGDRPTSTEGSTSLEGRH